MSCRKKVDFVDVFYKISLDFSLDISLDFWKLSIFKYVFPINNLYL